MEDFSSNNYALLIGAGAGQGTFIIERIGDGATTLRNTGSKAREEYNTLRWLYNYSMAEFDAACARMEFTL